MKKTIITIAVICIAALSVSAQENTRRACLPKGSNVINAGIGFTAGLSDIRIPPISVSYEHIVAEFGTGWGVGVGCIGGICVQKLSSTSSFTSGELCGTGSIHFSPIEKLDLYSGLHLGIWRYSTQYFSGNEMLICGTLGARYFFSDAVGGFLQFGSGGLETVTLGVAFKF